MPTLLVVQPDPTDPLDRFAPWFEAEGLAARVLRPFAGEALPASLDQDALLVLGGEMSVHDDADFPWLEDIRALYRDAAERGRPALGICLGAQLLAQTFGGSVVVGDRGVEAGVVTMTWRPEAAVDPLCGGLPDPFQAGSMHGDMIETLPPDATWLAGTATYSHQAFRVRDTAWGVQFHPEISLETYRGWVEDFTGSAEDAERARRGIEAFETSDEAVRAASHALAVRFAEIVRLSRAG